MSAKRWISTALWAPVNLVQAIFTLAWTALWISVALVVAALAGRRAALAMARRIWAPGLLLGAGARHHTTFERDLDPDRPRMYVANHQSFIDIPALFRALPAPLHFLAKSELGAVPLLGWYIRATGMVLVARGGRRRGAASVAEAARLLAAGRSVLSFPEGTRSRDGRLGRFRSGAFGAALASGVEVVPVGLIGSGKVLPVGGFRVRPGRIEVRVGVPIEAGRFDPDDRAGLAREAERAVARLLGETSLDTGRKSGVN